MKTIIFISLFITSMGAFPLMSSGQSTDISVQGISCRGDLSPSVRLRIQDPAWEIFQNRLLFSKPSSFLCKWDTILTYDSAGLKDRYSEILDTTGVVQSRIREFWQDSIWANFERYVFSYDLFGNEVEQLYQQFINTLWRDIMRQTCTFDAGNNLSTLINEVNTNSGWMNVSRFTFTNDPQGHMLSYLEEEDDSGTWVNSGKGTFTYDASGNMISGLYEKWENNAWVNLYLDSYTYNSSNQMLTYIVQDWLTNTWVNAFRNTYTYDASGNWLTGLYEEWETNAWVNKARHTNTCDASGNMLTQILDLWQNGSWNTFSRNSWSYDQYGNSLTGMNELWQGGTWVPGETLLEIYTQKNFSYSVEAYRYDATFIAYGLGIENLPQGNAGLLIYPVPAGNSIFLSIQHPGMNHPGSLAVYKPDGRQVMKQQVDWNKPEVDISGLPGGFYLVVVTTGTRTFVGKFEKY